MAINNSLDMASVPVIPAFGGTGVNNGSATLTLGGNTAFSGAFTFTGTLTGNTSVTFPTSGTLLSSSGAVTSITGTANQIAASASTGAVTLSIPSNPVLPGSAGVTLPTGNTAARAGAAGTIRLNSQSSVFEGTVDGSNWATFETSSTGVISVSGTANQIDVTPNTGLCVVSIDSAYAGQSSITTVGTIGTGTWNATTIGSAHGGTGINNGSSTITIGGNVAFSGAFTFTGAVTGNTSITFPTSGTLATTSQLPTLPLVVANGGTGLTTATTAYGVVCAGTTATAPLQILGALGATGTVLTSNGPSALPSFQAGGGGGGITTINTQVFSTGGTYTPTSGMVYCEIEIVGGGGGGGSNASSSPTGAGGGGGGGCYAYCLFTAADIGASAAIAIGAGGAGNTNSAGSDGATTSVTNAASTVILSANGGSGGPRGSSVSSSNGGSGGQTAAHSGGTGFYTIFGCEGGQAYAGSITTLALPGGSSAFGAGSDNSTAITGWGGGGSGRTSSSGRTGGVGFCKITEYCT